MRAFLPLVVVLALGCERSELLGTVGAPVGRGGGAGENAGGSSGAGGRNEGGAGTDPIGPLSDPEARDTDPTFTADLTELYFMSARTGSKNIMKSVRADPASEWGAPVEVPALSTGYQEENPRISADGLRLWFFSDRDRAAGTGTIWEVLRESRSDEWSAWARVPGLVIGSMSSDVSAGMNEDATLAVLSSRAEGASGYDLYAFERASSDASFGEPMPLTELNSASDDFDPYLTPNGLAIAFSSNRRGSFDIFLARRLSTDVAFEAPVPLELQVHEAVQRNRRGKLALDERIDLTDVPRDDRHEAQRTARVVPRETSGQTHFAAIADARPEVGLRF